MLHAIFYRNTRLVSRQWTWSSSKAARSSPARSEPRQMSNHSSWGGKLGLSYFSALALTTGRASARPMNSDLPWHHAADYYVQCPHHSLSINVSSSSTRATNSSTSENAHGPSSLTAAVAVAVTIIFSEFIRHYDCAILVLTSKSHLRSSAVQLPRYLHSFVLFLLLHYRVPACW